MNEDIKSYNSDKIEIKFSPESDEEINNFLENVINFGKLIFNNNFYRFKQCPNIIEEGKKFVVSGENNNILTKVVDNYIWTGTICQKKLELNKEYSWKIKILYTKYLNIFIGISTNDFNSNSASYRNGWYFHCLSSELYSGPPHNYHNIQKKGIKKGIKIEKKEKKEPYNNNINYEVIVIMNINKKTLKFLVNNEDTNKIYNDIPLDKPLYPAVLLYDKDDSVEIINN